MSGARYGSRSGSDTGSDASGPAAQQPQPDARDQTAHRVGHDGDPTGPLGLTGAREVRAHHGVEPLGGLDDAAPAVVGHRHDVGAWDRVSRVAAPVDNAERGELVGSVSPSGSRCGATSMLIRSGRKTTPAISPLAGIPHDVVGPSRPGQHTAADPGQHNNQLLPDGHRAPCTRPGNPGAYPSQVSHIIGLRRR